MTETQTFDQTIQITTLNGCIEIAIINGATSTTLDPDTMRELANTLITMANELE